MTVKGIVHMVSLGCPKNFVDAEIMAASLIGAGFALSGTSDDADVFLVNTCAFIPPARDEAEEHIRAALEWKAEHPGRQVVVTGCLNQLPNASEYRKRYPMIDAWLGLNDVEDLAAMIELARRDSACHRHADATYLQSAATPRLQLTPPHYAYLKIAEGCDNRCAYCSIPDIRGRLRSRPLDSVLNEAKNLLANGVKELIVIAQDTTAYGADLADGSTSLANLLRHLDDFPGNFWTRLMYAHPAHFNDELIDVFRNADHLLPYVDLPLQHISDRVLRAMGRKTTTTEINALLDKLDEALLEPAVRTTFMVGFPGETERDFEELLAFVHERRFKNLGAFTFHPEPGTAAADMPNAVSIDEAEARLDALMRAQADISLKRNEALVGRTLDVIVDAVEGNSGVGRTWMDAPDVDGIVQFHARRSRRRAIPGKFVKIKITSAFDYSLKGTIM